MSQYFESRQIYKYLGINKNQLFHWVQTKELMQPAVLGIGRGGRSQFTFDDLLDLALIKELFDFGFDLKIVKEIMKKIESPDFPDDDYEERKKTWGLVGSKFKYRKFIWEYYRKNKSRLNKQGYTLEIYMDDNGINISKMSGEKLIHFVKACVIPSEKEKVGNKNKISRGKSNNSNVIIIVNLLSIAMELENKIGEM